uniref:Uncharacterized protein n=1 Tax=Oryza punctata TaxID=4537 RepID=A0A0E0LWG8_ORYPU
MALESSKISSQFLSCSRLQPWTICIPQGSKPLHVPLNISFLMHAPRLLCTTSCCDCYAEPDLNHLNKADEDKVLDIQTILVKYNVFDIDQ